jgi:predicted nucleotidyltransferase
VIPLNSDFRDLLSLLNRYGVRYLIVGGYAVMLYTEPRYTKDLDVVIGTQPEELEGVRRALEEFGFPMSDDAAAKLALPNRILNEIEGVPFDEAWHRRGVIDVEGVQAPFISLQDLIAAKRAAGRPQDLLDLAELERAAKRKG